MSARQTIFRVRRNYNQWVVNETLEDYALRFTAKSGRRWSASQVAFTALAGAISFLALEAIGASITLHYGFINAVVAIVAVGFLIFISAIPISYYAARYGVDIDLLTRGAGFGYIGSTVTSLIYASFTFIFFALEAAIMALALQWLFGLPLVYGYLLCSVIVIPLVTHGITFITRFQLWTQPFWLLLQLAPFAYILYCDISSVDDWTSFIGSEQKQQPGFSVMLFGAAAAVLFSLIAQIGEQVDFLRFLPPAEPGKKGRWWIALLCGGPGWIIPGMMKVLAGSFLMVLAVNHGVPTDEATDPTRMYQIAFGYVSQSPESALALAGIFVILCQLKINVTNAYAGSIAWSNFFSRLTHSHPGRVVWLVFNVAIALLLMELGVYHALEQTLSTYAIIAVAWLGTLVADLVINKPLGFSPKHIEFRRAHLYDINPVGIGSMILASLCGLVCYSGAWGELAQSFAHFITLFAALLFAPLIAWKTNGKYYLARPVNDANAPATQTCCICEHTFESEDITHCPAYNGPICSLCCSLDARCKDFCKPGARYTEQLKRAIHFLLPQWLQPDFNSRIGHFLVLLLLINSISGGLLSLIYFQSVTSDPDSTLLLAGTLWKVFFLLIIITGIVIWLFVLAHESRLVAQEESLKQNRLLSEEIAAHEQTDRALQTAKEEAEAANLAKSRYLTGISHELRSPLNAVLGYAQLLEKDPEIPMHRKNALGVIRRSGEHLADLIEGLLDISKIEAGRLDLHRDEVQIRVLMDQLVHMFRLQAEAKGLYFKFHCSDFLPESVYTDEKRLRQILINLLSNAIKYTAQGGVEFHIHYRNQVAEFSIRDTGEGIASENLERIFRPFERVTSSRSSATGTGLGLTITRLLTDIMGGDINVSSQPGKGSLFKVSLMLSSIMHPRKPSLITTDPRTVHRYDGPRRHIVTVDDDATHRQLIREMLEPLGFVIEDTDNPLAMLETFTRDKNSWPDLLLLDVSMPDINGWQCAEQLRLAGFSPPILMISADASEGHNFVGIHDEQPHWHDAYIVKPVRLPLLLDTVGRLLELTWCYEPVAPEAPVKVTRIDALEIPDQEVLVQLHAFASIGHKKGLTDYLDQLEQDASAPAAFIAHCRDMANGFCFEALMQWLNSISDTPRHPASPVKNYAVKESLF